MSKKIIIVAGVAALALIAVLCTILFVFPGRGEDIVNYDTDSVFDYSFSASRRGLTVSITGSKEGYDWTAESKESIVTVSDATLEGEQTTFLLSPARNGTGRVEFTLCDRNDPSVRAYRLYADLLVSGNDISVISSGHLDISENIVDASGRFTVAMQDKGLYLVSMMPAAGAKWRTRVEGDSVFVESGNLWADSLTTSSTGSAESALNFTCFTLKCVGSEPTTVYIYDRSHSEALEIKMEYDEQSGLYPAECAMVPYQDDHVSAISNANPIAAFPPSDPETEEPEDATGETSDETAKTGSEEKE